MSKLAQLQADFQTSILKNDHAMFQSRVVDDAKVGAKKRLSIYADAYRLRIIEALSTAYPKLHSLLGDDLFDCTARQYIDQYPSRCRNMRWVGDQMSEHLLAVLPQHPIAAEVASFEWALGLAFDAEDAAAVTIEHLSEIPPDHWGALCFTLQPAVQLLDLQWNVVPVWQALDAEQTPPAPAQHHEPCLVWRSDLNSHYRSLETQEYEALKLILTGATFGDLCESLFASLGDSATQQAAQYLASWLQAGLIGEIKTD